MTNPASHASPRPPGAHDPLWVRVLIVGGAIAILGVLVVIPVVNVFHQALAGGIGPYLYAVLGDPDTRHAIGLTLLVAPLATLANVVFGLAAAWAITRFEFTGKGVLTGLIDLPLAVSPVVAGLMLMLIFGLQGYLGPWLRSQGISVVFALPGMVLATMFVTLPLVARELIPLMQALGSEEETAAVSLGANAWHVFWRVTLPNIKWGLLYGVIMCNARAMGEFGAVSVVSGKIVGETDTMPLRVERLYQDFNNPAAFALASVLTLLALVTLAAKTSLESQVRAQTREAAQALAE